MDEVRLGDASVKILPVVRGLPSEIHLVANAIDTTAPNVVAVSIGPEELQTLRAYHGGPLEPENFEEEVYVAGLSAWETPTKPPPCFTEAIRVADRRGARLEALDMDEVTYTENYVDCVSGLEVVFQGRLERRLKKKQFRAKTPQDFVIEWDAEVNGPPGFARLQSRREAYMAARLRQIGASTESVLALIEVERVKGILAALRA
jgi:pheromone shutdown protein TraB